MNSNPEEKQFRALFGELRQHDEHRVPSFERQLAAAQSLNSHTQPGPIWLSHRTRLAAVVGFIVVAVILGILAHRIAGRPAIVRQMPPKEQSISDVRGEQPIASLTNWESPTEFLLQAPDEWSLPVGTDESLIHSTSTKSQRHNPI